MITNQFKRSVFIWHQLDPRARLISAVILTLVIATTNSLLAALAGLMLGLLLAVCFDVSLKNIFARLKAISFFLIFLWLILPLTYTGNEVDLKGMNISLVGLKLTFLITVKSYSILIIFMSLIGTSSFTTLSRALRQLGFSSKLSWTLLFSYRYLSTIQQEYLRLRRAAMLRGFEPKTCLRTYRVYANMLGMTLVKAWLRAQKINQSMLLRGFKGDFHGLDPESTFSWQDLFWIFALLVLSAGLFLCP